MPWPTCAEPRPFSESSTIQSCSPARKLCDCTLFESIDEYVPLPNFGLSPKKTFTVFEHDERIVTETGPAGAAVIEDDEEDDDDGELIDDDDEDDDDDGDEYGEPDDDGEPFMPPPPPFADEPGMKP